MTRGLLLGRLTQSHDGQTMTVQVVYSPDHARHVPDGEIWVGVRIPGTELADRGEAILSAVSAAGYRVIEPHEIRDDELTTVHSPELVDFLRSAQADWDRSGYPIDPGQEKVVPYSFPHPDLLCGEPLTRPVSVGARTGMFAMDTMTLIGPGTWEAVRAAAACAVTAADLALGGDRLTYAAVRPPGHHAGRTFYGGACYLNNAALAAQRLSLLGVVAVIDIDAHHGNGTQQIFYDTDQVRYGSVHIDPDAGYFPHWVGREHERGTGRGQGANLNLPVPPGTGDREWIDQVKRLTVFSSEANVLVVSLGVDSFADDPESPLLISVEAHHRAGQLIGELDRPTVVVQEGGYVVDRLGELVVAFLSGLDGG